MNKENLPKHFVKKAKQDRFKIELSKQSKFCILELHQKICVEVIKSYIKVFEIINGGFADEQPEILINEMETLSSLVSTWCMIYIGLHCAFKDGSSVEKVFIKKSKRGILFLDLVFKEESVFKRYRLGIPEFNKRVSKLHRKKYREELINIVKNSNLHDYFEHFISLYLILEGKPFRKMDKRTFNGYSFLRVSLSRNFINGLFIECGDYDHSGFDCDSMSHNTEVAIFMQNTQHFLQQMKDSVDEEIQKK